MQDKNTITKIQTNMDQQTFLHSFSTLTKQELPEKYPMATDQEINDEVEKAGKAFAIYKNKSGVEKAIFLETIGQEIMALGDTLLEKARLESGLPEARLAGERGRTVNQLKLFAALLREGSWVDAVIDTALPDRKPLAREDIRKMLVPLGPVVVFGASNFPLAFSTSGGDTASALAAGNPVIVKAHQSHLGTNELVSKAIRIAAQKCDMPEGVFTSLIGKGNDLGMKLVKHEGIKAVGFTGSRKAGMILYKTAVNERKVPIPVYAEMSSTNPVLLLPGKVKNSKELAAQLAGSITLGTGQFCTNPGILFLLINEDSEILINELTEMLSAGTPALMLNPGICKSYYEGKKIRKEIEGLDVLVEGEDHSDEYKASAFLTIVHAADFLANADLQDEIFGPASLIVKCKDQETMLEALESLEGQLTGTVWGEEDDLIAFEDCITTLENKVGRILYNGVPTGVEVGYAMVHGGPFPATTDARSTSVGADAIKRFVRPFCYQSCPDELLPPALQNSNPLNLMRRVNGVFSKDKCE